MSEANPSAPGAALVVNNTGANIFINQSRNAENTTATAQLDLSGLDTFTATVGRLIVGADLAIKGPSGELKLAKTNTVTTAGAAPQLPGSLLRTPFGAGVDRGGGRLPMLTLFAVSLVGMAQVSATFWLSTDQMIPKDAAEQLIARLAWRGISGWPRAGEHAGTEHLEDELAGNEQPGSEQPGKPLRRNDYAGEASTPGSE